MMSFDSLRQGFTLTKVTGAVRQIDAALAAFEISDFDIAITLAAAAEGTLPRLAGSPLRRQIALEPSLNRIYDRGEIGPLNHIRDWLRQSTLDDPKIMKVTAVEAAAMIIRAMCRVPAGEWSQRMIHIENELLAYARSI